MHTSSRRLRPSGMRRRRLSTALASVAVMAAIGVTLGVPGSTIAVLTDDAPVGGTVTSVGTYDQRVKALNPVGYWRLNEAAVTGGTIAPDASGNGRNGTYVNGTLKFESRNTNYAGGNGYQYATLGVNATYTFVAGDRFEYDILLVPGTTLQGVDLIATDGTTLRDNNYFDQNGTPSHPAYYSASAVNWEHRVFTIAAGTALAGKTISQILLVNEADSSAQQAVWLSNIRVTSSAGVVKKSFWSTGDPVPPIIGLYAALPSLGTNTVVLGEFLARDLASPLALYGGSVPVTRFRGAESRVQVPDAAAFDMAAASAFTVEAWVNSNGLVLGSSFVSRAAAPAAEQYVLDFITNQVRFFVRKADGTFVQAVGPNVNDGIWHHLAGVFDNGTVSLYVDGALAQSQAGATGGLYPQPGGTPIRIGSRPGPIASNAGPYGSRAWITEVAIYRQALTLAQIQDHALRR